MTPLPVVPAERIVLFQPRDQLAPGGMQMRVHGTLGDAERGGDLGGLHPILPPHQRYLLLPRRHLPDDLARPLQRDRAQGFWAHRSRPCRTSAGRTGRTGPEFTARIMIM
jgi:hypothetical protein